MQRRYITQDLFQLWIYLTEEPIRLGLALVAIATLIELAKWW
jgi:hypothetical protein